MEKKIELLSITHLDFLNELNWQVLTPYHKSVWVVDYFRNGLWQFSMFNPGEHIAFWKLSSKKAMTKYILSLFMIASCCGAKGQATYNSPELNRRIEELKVNPPKRYFLIGYVGDNENGIFAGGEDTVLTHYPNLYDLSSWVTKKHRVNNCRIISVCEMSKEDYYTFWEEKNKKP